mmetsp:Transcript_35202/g.139850  ORF Transcript_35202/g.139850 Transcript_35202/m.139850 type:complete len:83 (+) Transcript_35202:2008-2256(+)
MPVFELQIRAVLDRVSSISAPSDYSWSFVFTCGSCGENTPKPVTFDESMSVDLIRGAKVVGNAWTWRDGGVGGGGGGGVCCC